MTDASATSTGSTSASAAAGGASPAKYDATRMYKVELNKAVECPPGSGRILTPGKNKRHHVRGDLVAGLGAALTSAKLI